MNKPVIICLTPMKNEAWALPRFLACASLWADHIILADQGSTDGSREIARQFPKVILVENTSPVYNERDRQKLLIDEARKIAGKRLLIAMDCDEILSGDFTDSLEWRTVLSAPAGTAFGIQWAQLDSGLSWWWSLDPPYYLPWGFMDDGSPHQGHPIHSPRVPLPVERPFLTLNHLRLLHYQYVDPRRRRSKERWYMCWEQIHDPKARPVMISRRYEDAKAYSARPRHSIPGRWLETYLQHQIDMTSVMTVGPEDYYWWDYRVLDWIREYGAAFFSKLPIWDIDWLDVAKHAPAATDSVDLSDPRSLMEKNVHGWLQETHVRQQKFSVRLGAFFLRAFGW